MKISRFFATAVVDYLELPNSSLLLHITSSYDLDSSYTSSVSNPPVGGGRNALFGSPLHTFIKSQRLRVGRWLAALSLSLGPVASFAQSAEPVQRDTIRGAARVAYAINDAKISPSFSENKLELEKITGILDQLLADSTATLQRVVIRGYGSPDGRFAFNKQLARRRTENLKAYVAKHAKLSAKLIEMKYVAEDWEGLTALVEETNVQDMPHRDEVLKLIKGQQHPDDKERAIRRLYPTDFLYLKNFCLPKLRRADYTIEYLTRNGAAAVSSPAVVSINSVPISKVELAADKKAVASVTAQTTDGAGRVTKKVREEKQTEIVQNDSGDSRGRLMLWLAIIAGLSLLLLFSVFVIRLLYRRLQEKDKQVEDLQKEIYFYKSELQRLSTPQQRDKRGVAPTTAVPVEPVRPDQEKPAVVDKPEVAPVVVSTPIAAPSSPAPKAEVPQTVVVASLQNSSVETPVVAQNSRISSQKEKFPKFRRNEGGDSDDFERYKLMDQAVTKQKLFLNADINRNQLMRLAGVDKNRLAQMMRKYANTNFAGYINSKRMDYAIQLIKEHPEYTMKTIAETCGFSSQSTFFRVFKSVYGITPTDFSHTGSLPRKEPELPFEEGLSESQNGQNDHKNGRIISFYTASDKA